MVLFSLFYPIFVFSHSIGNAFFSPITFLPFAGKNIFNVVVCFLRWAYVAPTVHSFYDTPSFPIDSPTWLLWFTSVTEIERPLRDGLRLRCFLYLLEIFYCPSIQTVVAVLSLASSPSHKTACVKGQWMSVEFILSSVNNSITGTLL